MSKVKVNVPNINVLKEYIEENGLKKLIDRYSCYDFLIGTEESIDFLHEKYYEYKKSKINSDETI